MQTTASRRKGEGKLDETAIPLNGGLFIVLCAAPPGRRSLPSATTSLRVSLPWLVERLARAFSAAWA